METIMHGNDDVSKFNRGKFERVDGELTEKELTAVVGGQLPGATIPPKIVLKRGKNSSTEI
jgi:bacteriocin-like protein